MNLSMIINKIFMKKYYIIFLCLFSIGFTACSGNKADGSTNKSYSTVNQSKSTVDKASGDTSKVMIDHKTTATRMPGQ